MTKNTAVGSAKKENAFFREIREHKILYLMILPTLCYFILFHYVPMVGVYFAFVDFNYADGLFGSPLCGFDNFKTLFQSGILLRLLRNTILYNIAFILIGNMVQLIMAILLSRVVSKWFKKTVQTLSFMPYFVSYVIVAAFSYILFNSGSGTITLLVRSIGFDDFTPYATPSVWPVIIVLVYLWKNVGYGMVVYLAAITSIDDGYYEASEIDGASVMQQIRYITIPLLIPTFIILLLLALGGIVRGQFELFYQLVGNQGLLYDSTDILDTYVFRMLQGTFDIGRGTAIGLFQSLFGLVTVCTVNWFVNRSNPEYALF